ncbi:MAG: recombinase family protein [Planctomycetes bacterium]|nr:recombinase family protein [Planctomycetota bacterium]
MMHLRQPIVPPKDRPLSVLIHARFSTEEQRQSSIDDQIAACRAFLDSGMPKGTKPSQVTVEVITEPEVSGEIADRPGINQVWAGIEAKRWDVIIAEESSRLYRHHTKAGELFESAVDAGVRVICPSDYIDTADDDWPDRLNMCQMQHARSNFYTRQRIRRAHDGLWARGAAIGGTRIGYKRRPTVPATATEPAKGPFYDEIDPDAVPIIREIFERIAAGERSVEVGEWLDSIKFAKASWARQAKWTAANVNAIIRRTIYRGFETNRVKVSKRKLRTGKSECVWNDEDKIQTRESPHLRMVSDHLWYKANELVDRRRVFKEPIRGAGHPLRGTTRQRRGLLAGVFACGCCGSPMYSYGKKDGSFRCSAAVSGVCWYRGFCMRERVYPAVLEAVVNEVLSLDGARDAVLARVRELHEQGGSVAAELKKLDKEEKKLVSGIERLTAAVESGDGALTSLTSRLADRERELAIVRSRRREVEEQASRKKKLPSAAKLLEHLEAVRGQLLGDENRAAVILRQLLDGPIRVVPFMRIDGKRVVPRLEFTINLVAALPPAVAAPLRQAAGDDVEDESVAMLKRTLMVNAFDEPQLVKHARVIVEGRLEGKTYKKIAKELNLTEYNMENCAAITRLMEAAGLPEPYRRLTEKPDYVPQWCSKHWLKAGERKGGGKRRRAS